MTLQANSNSPVWSRARIRFYKFVFFIASNIEERSVILVDEPENSLHVKWQLEYLNHILDIFHYFNVCVYVATHSPILVSGTLSSFPNSRVFEMENLSIKPVSNEYTGIEQELYSLFNVITPSNHFLSQKIIALINSLDSGDVSRSRFQDELVSLKRDCYDTRQQELIEMISDRISG